MRVLHMVTLGDDVSRALRGNRDDGVCSGASSRSRLFCLLRMEEESK